MKSPKKNPKNELIDEAVNAVVAQPRIPKLYTVAELVEMGVFNSEQGAANERYKGTGPKFLKLGEGQNGRIRYSEDDVVEWLESRKRAGTAEQ